MGLTEGINGCTDIESNNYNPLATIDNGNWQQLIVIYDTWLTDF